MITWNELANAQGTNRDALAAYVVNLAPGVVKVENLQTLLLAKRLTAVHETGHAVLYAARSDRSSRGCSGFKVTERRDPSR